MEQMSKLREDICERMLAKWEADKAKIKADVKAWHEMRERGRLKERPTWRRCLPSGNLNEKKQMTTSRG
jgi:hypothetical protein